MIIQATHDGIARAATVLTDGGLVAFPTETVYGLGADARRVDAIAAIYALKGRPAHNPLIMHVPDMETASHYGVFDTRAETLARALWPGPITLVVRARADNGLAVSATAGLNTVALRVPAHPTALALLRAFGGPVAAPSANPSGFLSPTSPLHVAAGFGERAPLILADGASAVGLESTIVDLSGDAVRVLRPGAIGADELSALLGCDVTYAGATDKIIAPGQLKRHYATKTPLRLNAVDVRAGEAFLAFGRTQFIGVAGVGHLTDYDADAWRNLSADGDLYEAAANLYAHLFALDNGRYHAIAVARIPETGLGAAINDRLRRASVPPSKNALE